MQHISQIKGLVKCQEGVCLTCPMSKFTKLPFQKSGSHAGKLFELLHIDTWGPYRVSTRGTYNYFLTIVDDFSRMTWRYLLKHKSDYLETLKAFCDYINTHFESSVKFIRTDNALEFHDILCIKFYTEMEIFYQTSCSYRPRQNARVERKHRHVLEISRALKLQSGLPMSFWGECVLTAAHIINRLPTPVLDNKTPYEILYNEPTPYEHLRVFGCLAFASNPLHTAYKFAPRSVPSVFIGYPPTNKGYRLLNLTTM